MTFYDEMAAIASGLLRQFDQGGITLDVYTGGGGSAWNPGATTYASNRVDGVASGVTAEDLKDSLVQSSDLVVTIPAGLVPKMQDRVSLAGVAHSIVKLQAVPATGTVCAWRITIRK